MANFQAPNRPQTGPQIGPARRPTESQQAAEAAVEDLVRQVAEMDPASGAAHVLMNIGDVAELDDGRRAAWTGELIKAVQPALEAEELLQAIAACDRRNGRRGRRTIELIPVSSITARPIRYTWAGRIVAGDLNLLAGAPGVGKGAISLHLAARISRGDLEGDLYGTPATVIIASAEDSPESVIKPRLAAAGADLDRVAIVAVTDADGDPDGLILPDDVALLADHVDAAGAVLVIIDPVAAHLAGSVDSHRDASIRKALAPLARLAHGTGASVLPIAHLNKAQGGDWVRRIGGSVGLAGAARNILLAGDAPDGDGRVLIHCKSNTGELATTLRYRVEGVDVVVDDREIYTCRTAWLGELENIDAADMLDPPEDEERGALGEAREWLQQYLEAGGGSAGARECLKAAKRDGITERTLQRARGKAGITTDRDGHTGAWAWRLPDSKATTSRDTRHLGALSPCQETTDSSPILGGQDAKAPGANVSDAVAPCLEFGDGDPPADADDGEAEL